MNSDTLFMIWENESIHSVIVFRRNGLILMKAERLIVSMKCSRLVTTSLWNYDEILHKGSRWDTKKIGWRSMNEIRYTQNTTLPTYVGLLRCLIILFFQRKMHWITKPRKRITLFAYFSFVCFTTNQSSTCLHKPRCWFIRW